MKRKTILFIFTFLFVIFLVGCKKNRITHTVTFVSNCEIEINSQEVINGKKVVKPDALTKKGYTFLGWFNKFDQEWVFRRHTVKEDITLTAKWEANTYQVTLNLDGGSSAVSTLEVTYDKPFTLPIVTKADYQLYKWVDSNNKEVDQNKFSYLEDQTFKAVWGKSYTLTFDSDGGNEISSIPAWVNISIDILPTPFRDGAVFLGWYNTNDELVSAPFVSNVANNITLIAKWRLTVGDYTYTELDDKTITIIGYIGNDTEIVIPNVINNKTVSAISSQAFNGITTLTKIALSKDIKSVGDEAFSNCTALTEIIFNTGISTYGDNLLLGCTSLSKVSIDVLNFSFTSFFDLDEVNIPSDMEVTYLSNKTSPNATSFFSNMNSKMLNIVISDLWNSIPNEFFMNIHNIKTMSFESENVKSIGNQSFYNCTSLTSVALPESITFIGEYAFWQCTSLINITIPNSITFIGQGAFSVCESLTSFSIPENLTIIAINTFNGCSSLSSISIPKGVTSLRFSAFTNCTSLTIISIPESVTSIDNRAFDGCESLLIVYYEGTKNNYIDNVKIGINNDSLKKATFVYESNNIKLENIVTEDFQYIKTTNNDVIIINSINKDITNNEVTTFFLINHVIAIRRSTFEDCTSLTSIVIPNSVTSIQPQTFRNCTSLTSITIPSSVTSIGNNAFWRCISLTSIIIPNGVTSIGDSAFEYCISLTSIALPNSLTSIGDKAFYVCESLTSITIPESVKSIGNNAFGWCTTLTIHCVSPLKPSGWHSDWNSDNRPVIWGYINK